MFVMIKSLKIIICFFGNRRPFNNNPSTPEDSLEFLKQCIDVDKELDSGEYMDILLVNNKNNFLEGDDFVASLAGKNIKRGVIKVMNRENLGGSFGSFSDAYDLYNKEYDYFLFNEDDIQIQKENYFSDSIEKLNSDKKIGFVAFAPIHKDHPNHSGGGFGITSNTILQNVLQGSKIGYEKSVDYFALQRNEIEFTNIYPRSGFSIVNLDKYCTLASNYTSHGAQNRPPYNLEILSGKPFLYKVGF